MQPIVKRLSVSEVENNLLQIVEGIVEDNSGIILEVEGEARAAVVPIALYEQWLGYQQSFLEKLRNISERIDLDPAEADMVANDLVQSVRSRRKKARIKATA
ncbi:MAG: hypothetical protein M3328_07835 [Chloroflexota bacterium]|nr:hypothetical protein [Chloroflexota bacterium]